jgi:hypothetical protein
VVVPLDLGTREHCNDTEAQGVQGLLVGAGNALAQKWAKKPAEAVEMLREPFAEGYLRVERHEKTNWVP